jgi:SAM-dependent methyltransferase
MKAHAPATERNREPIAALLARLLTGPRRVLEIASGTGQHAVFFTSRLPEVSWQPTDIDDDAMGSIAAWSSEADASNVRAPIKVDVLVDGWWRALGEGSFDAVVCINMIHIAPWEACLGLLRGARSLLVADGLLFLYGPFRFGGAFTATSNAAFDMSLRARDPRWGVRDLDEVTAAAAKEGFQREEVVAMPANNHSVVFRAGIPAPRS